MSEQDLHDEPVVEPDLDPEAVIDETDELERLDTDIPVGLEVPEADAVEQRLEADPAEGEEDAYPPH